MLHAIPPAHAIIYNFVRPNVSVFWRPLRLRILKLGLPPSCHRLGSLKLGINAWLLLYANNGTEQQIELVRPRNDWRLIADFCLPPLKFLRLMQHVSWTLALCCRLQTSTIAAFCFNAYLLLVLEMCWAIFVAFYHLWRMFYDLSYKTCVIECTA